MRNVYGNGLVGLVEEFDAVPNELDDLLGFMARTIEARRAQAERVSVDEEVYELLDVELDILRKAADVRAESIEAVIGKLAIWELVAEDHDDCQAVENAVIRSVLGDLRRLEGSFAPRR